MKTESIIFDMDGTIWDSAENVACAWNEAIKYSGNPLLRNKTLTDKDIKGIMGMTMDAIAEKLFPELSSTLRTDILNKCTDMENEYLARHGGKLFDNVENVLTEMSKKHRLFIVSNCQRGYIEAFFEHYGFERLFTDYLCWGDTGKEKHETIRILMEKNRISSAVYVGDTAGDMISSEKAGIPFVYASYGFGKLPEGKEPAAVIETFSDITGLFD
ncbi:MAG: HAD family hydrolase [Huintestinicola sp.]